MMPSYSPTDQSFSHVGYQGGFRFQKRHGRIDWKKLAAVDVDRIAREVDVQTLQDNIAHVAFCDVESELSIRDADSNLIKLFRLAQLLVEYLLHSQEYLQGYITQIECQMKNSLQDQSNLRDETEKKGAAYKNLKREYQKSKKLIAEYQMMLRAGASGFHKCPFCAKSFLSDEFLKAHILRRHTDKAASLNIQDTTSPKLIDARGVQRHSESFANQEELLKELSNISSKLQETEARLVAERQERDRQFEASRELELRRIEQFSREQLQAKNEEIAKMKNDIESHKDMFLKEINELHAEKNTMEKRFQDLYEKTKTRPSMLGTLQDVSAVDGHRDEDITQIKEQLQDELMSSYQSQLEKVNKMAKRREEQMKKVHNEEMEKVTNLLMKLEGTVRQKEEEKEELKGRVREDQALYSDRFKRYEKRMEEQQMQMSKMEEMLNTKRSGIVENEEMIIPSKIEPAAVLASTPMTRRSLEIPQDQQQQSDDTILLHVASNSKNIFRVWRTPSPSISEWRDTLVFRASLIEKGQFNQPIYVFYASGSPYWRQYVSRSSTPPRSCYKFDFKFYVSNVQLMGTTRFFVLDAGSGEVVKSMISKSEIYPGWKPKGLSFFALKGPQEINLQKSVSFQSTLNESEFDSGDDVSVSSYTGTEDARKHLAAAITKTRSNENIIEQPKEEVKQINEKEIEEENSFQPSEEEEEEEEEENEEEEDVTYDETDGKLGGTGGSTSQWGSTLLQTGSFLPFPHNPMAVARYNHSKEMLEACRHEAIEFLKTSLESRGQDPDAPGIDNIDFAVKMNMHQNEVKVKTKTYSKNKAERQRIVEGIDRIAKEYFRNLESQKTPDKSAKSKFKSAVNKIKNAARFARSPRKKDDSKSKSRGLERTNSFINKSFDDQPSIKGASIEEPPTPKQEPDINHEVFDDVSENSKWDSEVSSDLSPVPTGSVQLPTVTVKMPGRNDNEQARSTDVSSRQIRGEKVRKLTESLEPRLLARDIKKPAGAVDLHDTNQSIENNSCSKGRYTDDYDDDDDFSISSVEDEYMAPPSSKMEEKDRTVASQVKRPYGSSTTLEANETVISKFTADSDFDSDSDLGL